MKLQTIAAFSTTVLASALVAGSASALPDLIMAPSAAIATAQANGWQLRTCDGSGSITAVHIAHVPGVAAPAAGGGQPFGAPQSVPPRWQITLEAAGTTVTCRTTDQAHHVTTQTFHANGHDVNIVCKITVGSLGDAVLIKQQVMDPTTKALVCEGLATGNSVFVTQIDFTNMLTGVGADLTLFGINY
jgi:hypothetical protein